MKNNQFSLKQKLQPRNFLGSQYIVLASFWMIFIALLIAALILFINERARIDKENNVNEILNQIAISNENEKKVELYRTLLKISYPLIDFSLMSFNFIKTKTPAVDPATAWTQRVNTINTAYSYIFITILIAIIALVYYLILVFKLYQRRIFEKKYHLTTVFPNDYIIFDTKMYLNFILNLAIVFSFFNFLTSIIVLVYGLILVLTSYFFWYILKIKSEILVKHKWWKSANFVLFTFVLLIQNGYTLLKSIFAQQFDVNLDLILAIILPIGTITIVLTLLIKNMLDSQIKKIKNDIKTIDKKITAFQIFFYTQKEKALEDYTFVAQLPTFVRKPLQNNKIDKHEAFQRMIIIDEATTFFQQNFHKPKELNYMLYHLFNNITDSKEITEIKNNITKINQKQTKKDFKIFQ